MTADSALYYLDAARSEAQRRRMERLEEEGVCVFCREHTPEADREPLLLWGEHWYVTENAYPYAGTRSHYLIVPHRHVASFDELPDEAGAELWVLKRKLKAQLQPVAVATVERSGDMRYNGGSVAHLHVHFVTLDEEPSSTVRFRVSAYAIDETSGEAHVTRETSDEAHVTRETSDEGWALDRASRRGGS
jgi:ATP adenylyltransferase